jgi:hypothetical protein
MICCICRNQVDIPVELICFPCYKSNDIHCNSFVRVCLSCSIDYLQLNKSTKERDPIKKCLFCPQKCILSQLTFENSYRIDTVLLREMESKLSCRYCEKEFQNSLAFFRHIKTCDNFFFQCKCGFVGANKDREEHKMKCRLYRYCDDCKKHFHLSTWTYHQNLVHERVLCTDCKIFVPWNELITHLVRECPKRKLSCNICEKDIPYDEFEEHLNNHEKQMSTELISLKTDFENKLVLYQKLQKKKQALFPNDYLL